MRLSWFVPLPGPLVLVPGRREPVDEPRRAARRRVLRTVLLATLAVALVVTVLVTFWWLLLPCLLWWAAIATYRYQGYWLPEWTRPHGRHEAR